MDIGHTDSPRRPSIYSRMCYSLTTFFFSRIGLCFLVIAYSIGGGFVFKAIESPSEKQDLARVQQSLDAVVRELLAQSNQYLVLIEKNWTAMARTEILKYQAGIIRAVKQRGYLGTKYEFIGAGLNPSRIRASGGGANEQWNTAGAVLYAVTVITSIGYGNITCKTTAGRVLTILYASCGIPLILIFLANMGSTMADSFRFIYSRVCCAYCHMIMQRRRRRWVQRNLMAAGLVQPYSAVPGGYALSAMGEQIDDQQIEGQSVPISVTLMLLISYIFIGAIFFSQWENWSLFDGFYFCFITLTTIGLGDFVPGRSLSPITTSSITQSSAVEQVSRTSEINDKSSAEGKLVLCAFYLTIGLSLLVMCFNLVEEKVRVKCRGIGIQLGIYDDEDTGRATNPQTRNSGSVITSPFDYYYYGY